LLRLDYQPVFWKMNPHSSINLLKQVFKLKIQQMEYTLRKTKYRNPKKSYLGYERTKSAKFVLGPSICMFRTEHR